MESASFQSLSNLMGQRTRWTSVQDVQELAIIRIWADVVMTANEALHTADHRMTLPPCAESLTPTSPSLSFIPSLTFSLFKFDATLPRDTLWCTSACTVVIAGPLPPVIIVRWCHMFCLISWNSLLTSRTWLKTKISAPVFVFWQFSHYRSLLPILLQKVLICDNFQNKNSNITHTYSWCMCVSEYLSKSFLVYYYCIGVVVSVPSRLSHLQLATR